MWATQNLKNGIIYLIEDGIVLAIGTASFCLGNLE
jgi:hypothetical protein